MKRFRMNLMAAAAAGLMLVVLAGRSEAQVFRLAIDEITVTKTTDVSDICGVIIEYRCGAGNDLDEVYFSVAGVTVNGGAVSLPRVSPPGPNDYYGLKAARDGGPATKRSIPLIDSRYQWFELYEGQSAFFTVLIREQDNAQRSAISNALGAGASAMLGITLDGTLAIETLRLLANAARDLIDSLTSDHDDTIGAFTVLLSNSGNQIRATWEAQADTALLLRSNSAALFKAVGGRGTSGEPSDYMIQVHVQQLVRMARNFYSQKCLDVEYGSPLSTAVVQQYSCQLSTNQAWILSPLGVSTIPAYTFTALHSGHCLDVVGENPNDHAAIQQYTCHFGRNQQWQLEGPHPYYSIRNLNGISQCLDVPHYLYPAIQQFRCHWGPNQKWYLAGYLRFAP